MFRPVLLIWCLAACEFTAARPTGGAVEVDASVGTTGIPDGAAPAERVPCATPDPSGLVLCLELEDRLDDGALADSSPAHRDADTAGLSPALRAMVGGGQSAAARVMPGATTRVPQSGALDRQAAYTTALWAHPDSLPGTNQVMGLLDHEQQYAMLIGHSPAEPVRVRCVHTGVADFEYTENLPADMWSFLACTWDGAQLCAHRWTSATDHQRYCHVPSLGPAAAGVQGLSIGHLSSNGAAHSRFEGALDSVQLYDRALTADQLCALLGAPAGCLPLDN